MPHCLHSFFQNICWHISHLLKCLRRRLTAHSIKSTPCARYSRLSTCKPNFFPHVPATSPAPLTAPAVTPDSCHLPQPAVTLTQLCLCPLWSFFTEHPLPYYTGEIQIPFKTQIQYYNLHENFLLSLQTESLTTSTLSPCILFPLFNESYYTFTSNKIIYLLVCIIPEATVSSLTITII